MLQAGTLPVAIREEFGLQMQPIAAVQIASCDSRMDGIVKCI